MAGMPRPLSRSPGVVLAAALALLMIAAALWQLQRADGAVAVTRSRIGPTPVSVYRSAAADAARAAPVVVVAHGFAGSRQLMQPFATALARNGYLAVTFDFLGHGRNRQPLSGDVTEIDGATRDLVAQTGEVVDWARRLPGGGEELALLGHSMASDIVVRYAQQDASVDAVVAVSMFSPAVTARSPRNLLVIVGGLEGFLKREALRVLELATERPEEARTFGHFGDGTARRVVFADGVEHLGVLYSEESLREAVAWLNAAFARPGTPTVQGRGPAIVLLLLGLILLAIPLARLLPRVSSPPRGAALPWRRLLPATLLPAVATPLLLARFPADFLGVLVGGYLAVHFLVYGLLSAACLWWLRRDALRAAGHARPAALLLATLCATLYVAGVIAWALDTQVTSFAITTPRLPIFAAMLAGTLSYFLADEWLTRGAGAARGGHLFARAAFLLSLGIAVALSFEDLFFLVIIAAIIVIYFLVYGLFSRLIYAATGHPAVGAVANAVAFAWALAAVFPLMTG